MATGLYTSSVKKCVIPHYNSYTDSIKLPANAVFEAERGNYEKYGDSLSGAITGVCLPDQFSYYGLLSRENYIKNLFNALSCFTGQDVAISFLVASPAYKLREKDALTQRCPSNLVFKKGCLIIPRGEIVWSLLAIDSSNIAQGESEDDVFKIFIKESAVANPNNPGLILPSMEKKDEESRIHYEHLKIPADQRNITSKESNNSRYVYLNPTLYNRIKTFRCISPHEKTIFDQDFMLFSMNLMYVQSLSALALVSTPPKRLLQYPPGSRESICPPKKDSMCVLIPKVENLDTWSIQTDDGLSMDEKTICNNVVLVADAKRHNTCNTTNDLNHNIIHAIETQYMNSVREEYNILKSVEFQHMGLDSWYDIESQQFWKKIIINSYPNKVKNGDEDICTNAANCILTPLGVVAIRNICEGDPLIFKDHTINLKKIWMLPRSGWKCDIIPRELPVQEQLNDTEKAGIVKMSDPKIQKNPLNYNPSFITSLGTNISLLSD